MSENYPSQNPTTGISDPGGNTIILQGRNAAGVAHDLYKGSDGVSSDGDLVELGFYKTAAGAANVDGSNYNPHRGVWTPLTTTTTIGHKYWNGMASETGEFYFTTLLNNGLGGGDADIAATNNAGEAGSYKINDTQAALSDHFALLDDVSGTQRLGVRFYDIGQSSNGGGVASNKAHGNTRYQTIMADAWQWNDATQFSSAIVYMQLHNDDGSVGTTDHDFEFSNSAHNAYSKVGTAASGGTAVGSDNYVASITYHDESSAMALNSIGSVVLSGLSGSGDITDGGTGKVLTLHTAAGNMLVGGNDDGTSFAGGIAGDITLIKTGGTAGHAANDGEQTLTGVIALTDTTGYADIKEGTLILAPNGNSQSFEYVTGAGNLILDSGSGSNAQTLQLGFATATNSGNSGNGLSGTVTLKGSNDHTIKVASGTASGDYDKEQVFSGQVTRHSTEDQALIKSGVGRLKLTNSGNNFTHASAHDVVIEDGTLVASHANALGGSGNSIHIKRGKLELDGGISLSNTSIVGDNSGKSMVGGDGTVSALIVGSGNTAYVDHISPGRGISSSISAGRDMPNQQVTLGTGGAAANAMGDLTVTSLQLLDGGVYDWEIADFTGSSGTGFDVLKFGTLAFDSGASASFIVNAFSVASNGTAGAIANLGDHDGGGNGILFLDSVNDQHSDITWGHSNHTLSAGSWQQASYFNVSSDAYNYHNGNLNGGWGVWYNGSGDFYLRYSAVPEPSTYVMVTGLLLLPGLRFLRRFRKGLDGQDNEGS